MSPMSPGAQPQFLPRQHTLPLCYPEFIHPLTHSLFHSISFALLFFLNCRGSQGPLLLLPRDPGRLQLSLTLPVRATTTQPFSKLCRWHSCSPGRCTDLAWNLPLHSTSMGPTAFSKADLSPSEIQLWERFLWRGRIVRCRLDTAACQPDTRGWWAALVNE